MAPEEAPQGAGQPASFVLFFHQHGHFGFDRGHVGRVVIADVIEQPAGQEAVQAARHIFPGFELFLKFRHPAHKQFMLTARGDDVDRVVGLELGADDYVPKPCTPRELVARIRAILRRTQGMGAPAGEGEACVSAGLLELRPERRSATWGGQSLELTAAEFNLLEVLVRHVGQVVDKNALSQEGMGRPLTRYDRSIDVHISSIRRKLANCTPTELIQTIRGVGYQLIRE